MELYTQTISSLSLDVFGAFAHLPLKCLLVLVNSRTAVENPEHIGILCILTIQAKFSVRSLLNLRAWIFSRLELYHWTLCQISQSNSQPLNTKPGYLQQESSSNSDSTHPGSHGPTSTTESANTHDSATYPTSKKPLALYFPRLVPWPIVAPRAPRAERQFTFASYWTNVQSLLWELKSNFKSRWIRTPL